MKFREREAMCMQIKKLRASEKSGVVPFLRSPQAIL